MQINENNIFHQELQEEIFLEAEIKPGFKQYKNLSAISYKNNIYIFGGFNGKKNSNKLYIFNKQKQWNKVKFQNQQNLPQPRNGHVAVLVQNKMYLIGGWIDKGLYQSNEIYILDLDLLEWEKKISTGEYPGPCNMHTAEVYKDQIYVFRGGDGQNYLNDLHSLNINSFQWKQIQTKNEKPQPRAHHSSCLINEEMYIFGGWDGIKRLNDLHKLNLENLKWEKIMEKNNILPNPRAGMKILSIENNIYMFGGSGNNVTNGKEQLNFNDFWIFQTKENIWTQSKIQVKGDGVIQPRSGYTFSILDDQIYVFGGSCGTCYFDTYIIFDVNPKPQLMNNLFDYDNMFLQNVSDYFNNEQFSDICIRVQNKKFFAHKIVLSSFSNNFKMMFNLGMVESRINDFEINNINAKVFEIILQSIYKRNLLLQGEDLNNIDLLFDIFQASDQFLLEKIKIQVCQQISNVLNIENYSQIYEKSQQMNCQFLIKLCQWYKKKFVKDQE